MPSAGRSRLTPLLVTMIVAFAWAAATYLILSDSFKDDPASGGSTHWGPVVGLAGLAALVTLSLIHVRRELRNSADRENQESIHALERVISITEVALNDLPLIDLLEEMSHRVLSAVGADLACVQLVDGDELVVRAACGAQEELVVGARLPLGAGFAGRIAAEGRSMVALDLAAEAQLLPELTGKLNSAVGSPLRSGGRTVGVLTVAAAEHHVFADNDIRLIELAADRLAKAFEGNRLADSEHRASLGADHARRHLRLVGDASRIFMQSVDDYEPSLLDVIDLALRDFASFGAVVLSDSFSETRLLTARQCAPDGETHQELGGLPRELMDTVRTVMTAGQSRLATCADPENLACNDGSRDTTMVALGLTTYVVAPIQVRGLAFGAMIFGTSGDRRGFRRSDQHAIEELTRRTAIAIEASLLYREALASARISSGHLQRLRGVIDVWLGLAVVLDFTDIVRLAADGACRVLPASSADILLADGSGARGGGGDPLILSARAIEVLTAVDRPSGLGSTAASMLPDADRLALGMNWMAAPIRPGAGPSGVIVVRPTNGDFSPEDESLLVLLTQIVSARLANAALNKSTEKSEARLSALLSASPAPIIALSAGGLPIEWNPAASMLYGWTPVGEEHLPQEVSSAVEALTRLVRNGAETVQVECHWPRPDGGRDLLLMLAPITSSAGEIDGFILVTTDDTSRRRLADQFHQSQRLEVVGRLAGGVAHDFNNLLTVILGYTDGLLRKFEDEDPIRRRVEAIHRAGAHAAELTKELLAISRHQVVQPIVLEPAAFVSDIAGMLERIIGDNVHLDLRMTDESLAVRIDPMQLEQVMLNLAANARDAMPEGGTLSIEIGTTEGASAGRTSPTPDHVAITLSDTGAGMDAATLEHCIEPFFTTKQPGRGTGLGLAAVLGIVDQSGGDLWIDSQIGVGTNITIVLPRVTDAAEERHVISLPTPRDPVESRIGTVLVVDDDQAIRGLVTSLLRDRGYKVLAAHSGPAAVQMAASYDGAIDLLLTDVAMPAMSGVELAQTLHPILEVPVLFMSGFAEEFGLGEINGRLEANFIAKPFTPDDLVVQVQRAIDGVNVRQPSKR